MQPTSGLLNHLHQRLGRLGLLLLAIIVVLAVAAAVALVAVTELYAATDSIQVAPFRWITIC